MAAIARGTKRCIEYKASIRYMKRSAATLEKILKKRSAAPMSQLGYRLAPTEGVIQLRRGRWRARPRQTVAPLRRYARLCGVV